MVLSLVLGESSIELVPSEIVAHPAILSWAHRKRKDPRHLILDQSYHHAAIERLAARGLGRGRPDIVHFSLLLALGSPLSLDGHLTCIVHTRDNKVIRVSRSTRLPRNTDRFVTLLEQLYQERVVPATGPPLLALENGSLSKVIEEIAPDIVIALTTQGSLKPMSDVASKLAQYKKPVLIVGGFPQGHFSKQTQQLASDAYRIDRRKLEAWTVVARAVYDFERALSHTGCSREPTLM